MLALARQNIAPDVVIQLNLLMIGCQQRPLPCAPDALFEAGNLIDQIRGLDDDRKKELDERFEERKFVLEAS